MPPYATPAPASASDQDWQAGKLSREALQLYAAQYYRHVEAFRLSPGEIQQSIL
jgi:hypothetical protein